MSDLVAAFGDTAVALDKLIAAFGDTAVALDKLAGGEKVAARMDRMVVMNTDDDPAYKSSLPTIFYQMIHYLQTSSYATNILYMPSLRYYRHLV